MSPVPPLTFWLVGQWFVGLGSWGCRSQVLAPSSFFGIRRLQKLNPKPLTVKLQLDVAGGKGGAVHPQISNMHFRFRVQGAPCFSFLFRVSTSASYQMDSSCCMGIQASQTSVSSSCFAIGCCS